MHTYYKLRLHYFSSYFKCWKLIIELFFYIKLYVLIEILIFFCTMVGTSLWKFLGRKRLRNTDIYGLNFNKIGGILFFRGNRSPLLEGLTIIERSWNYGNLPYLVANTHGFNFIKIGGIWIFPGGGGRNPILGGLHLICDAHFQTRMGYSSQKSCVKIWFGLVEIGGMLILRVGGRRPLLGGLRVTCDAHFRTCPSYSVESLVWKFGWDWNEPFKSYCVHRQKKKNNWIFRGA